MKFREWFPKLPIRSKLCWWHNKNLDCLSRLKLPAERSYDFLFKDVILEKLEGRRLEPIGHTPGYEYFSQKCINKIVFGFQISWQCINAFCKPPLKEMRQLFDFKDWSKSFKVKNWGIDAMNALSIIKLTIE